MKLNRVLASTRLAFILIASLLFLIVISAIIPQQDFAAGQIVDWKDKLGESYGFIEKLGLDRIYYTPTFFIVLGLLAINLAAGNIRRFRLIYKSEKTLLRLRYIGSVIFHLSLFTIMGGVILHYLYQYQGVFAITEGQQVSDGRAEYFREFKGPLYADRYDTYKLRLDSLTLLPDEIGDLGSRASVTLTPVNSIPISANIQTNNPLVVISDSTGVELFRSFVRLAHRKAGGRDVHFDSLYVPDPGLKLEMHVVPGENPSESITYKVSVYRGDSLLYSGDLITGDTVQFHEYSLSVSRLRQWCYISAMRNPFLGLIFAAFWTALSGMLISFVPRVMKRD
jgi:hypothetical protein